MGHLIAPSLLSADFSNLKKDIDMINHSKADWFHIDIMDGMFVPNISFGFPVLKFIARHTEKPLDMHLMILDPDRYIERFREAGAEWISVHYETCPHLHRSLQLIRSTGAKAGIVLNPHSPVSLLDDIISAADYVLLMSVNPGYGGQKFIENTYKKIKELKGLILENGSKTLIQIDGGVNLNNAPELLRAGADILVAGNSVFSSDDPLKTIEQLKKDPSDV
ncbi:MAG: ribulose-phosphate 3-epimerase [Bacteroidales bacterium]|nr:ribulose-phosphate 3-epimerase [Bacteroidales bacterium]MCF8344937.1 ribulose-phosphate 3-epimerase [Bacteroidales bacterium]MCF8350841.1 ribulose-phosphate 3-epimerase [Bacteroidales bacterium]MCF8375738.1 ribulose-phosphate 3-epimerase [Bacteroidales bacterium]MCF8400338.1 ribulose-phosphate 3-epimerase [Bacteroidales bacterium]